MPKLWSDVAESDKFKTLPDSDKDTVRDAYFEKVVAPEVAPDQIDATRVRFDTASGYRKRALSAGVKPSEGRDTGANLPPRTKPDEGPSAGLAAVRV